MQTSEVMAWVAGYERAWRSGDLDAVEQLFTEQAEYRFSPYEPTQTGHAAIKGFWRADEGEDFTFAAEPVAVQDDRAVVRARVVYTTRPQEYLDLWLLRFADDGRVSEFEEWAYWPGSPYSAPDR